MQYRYYRYQMGIIAAAAVISIASYLAVLDMLDSIIANFDVYSFARQVSDDPQKVERRYEQMMKELADKNKLLESAQARNAFSQDVFRELAGDHSCRLIHLSNRSDVDKLKTIYEASYSGTVRRVLDLLHDLESNYLVNVNQASMKADDEAGTRVQMTVAITVGNRDFR